MANHSLPLARSVHHAILYFQRKMRTVRQQLPNNSVPLDISLILMIMNTHEELIPSELAHYTGLTPSQVSRRLAKLEAANLITRIRGTDGLRTVSLHFTPDGRKAIQDVWEQNNLVTDLGSRPLNSEETGFLEEFFRKLMDQFGTPGFAYDPRARPLHPQQRRMVRGMKMVGPDYLDTGIELNVFHVLLELNKVDQIRFKDLHEMLPISNSGLSRILASLQSDRFVKRKVQRDNVKNVYFSLTEKGKEYFKKLEEKTARRILDAIDAMKEETVIKALTILEKCYSRPVSITAETSLEIIRCVTKKHFFQARAFFLERLVEARRHTSLSSSILPDDEICFMALKNNQAVGLLHAKGSKGMQLKLVAFEFLDTEAEAKDFLLEAIKKTFPHHKLINAEVFG